jgi:hypothetical protein
MPPSSLSLATPRGGRPPAARQSRFRGGKLGHVAVLALTLVYGSALAQSSPYYIGLSQTLGYDSNLLRLGVDQNAPPGFFESDSSYTTSLLGGFDQGIGRQRVFANASLRDTRYNRNKIFNNQGYNVRAGMDWSTVERLSGSINFSANRNLQRFNSAEIGFLREKNLETVRSLTASASLGLITEYSLEVSGGRTEVSNSLQEPSVQARQFTQENANIGLRWRPSAVSSIGLSVGSTRGRYPKFRVVVDEQEEPIGFEADRFKRDDVELSASYRATGASSLEAQISSGKTVYDLNSQRDFSGLTGRLAWTWQATGKLVFTTAVTRDTGQESYATAILGFIPATADYSRKNTVWQVSTGYTASSKVSITSSVLYYRGDLVRTIDVPVFGSEADGRDKVTQISLGARWAPLRSVMVGCDLSDQNRRGEGALGVSLRGTTFSCYGQLTLQ